MFFIICRNYFLFFIIAFFLTSCSSIGKVENKAVSNLPTKQQRYSAIQHSKDHDTGETLLVLAFSGGGTRAAALSYGVLEELRDTHYSYKGNKSRLLDEVDRISSVSGGSFTSAYYGLFGDQIFEDFKGVFLYRDVQNELSGLILGFFDIIQSLFSTKSRTEKAIKYYDKHIFRGKTFADLQKAKGPFILINATDLNSQSQFVFTQPQFDFLCSDISQFKVARAVAASSSVPLLFPPILIKKHSDCHFKQPKWLAEAEQRAIKENDKRLSDTVASLNFYLDKKNPPYVTLLDGGITDNLGLHTLLRTESVTRSIQKQKLENYFSKSIAKRVVIIVVDASTTTETDIGKNTVLPSIHDVLSSITDIQLHLYNTETNSLLKERLKQWSKTLSTNEHPITPYFIDLNVTAIEDPLQKIRFNKIPTSFSLEKEQVDMLIGTARNLLRKNPEYIRLLKDIKNDPID